MKIHLFSGHKGKVEKSRNSEAYGISFIGKKDHIQIQQQENNFKVNQTNGQQAEAIFHKISGPSSKTIKS